MDEGQDQILRKDGKAYEDIEAILSNLYGQNQKMEKEMAELRAVAMVQRETMEKTDKVVAKLESRINEQDRELKIMKQEVRTLGADLKERGAILKHMLQESKKCAAELHSAKQRIKLIEKVVDIGLSQDVSKNAPRKTIIQNSRKVTIPQNKKIKSSSKEMIKDLNQTILMRTGINVSIDEFQKDNNMTTMRKKVNQVSMTGHYEGGKYIGKQLRNGKIMLSKRDTPTEGVAFSAYLDHVIYHMGVGHTIKCNQVLLNDGNHYNSFTGIFTVPQTGVYLLTFSFSISNINDHTEVRLLVNNREIVDAVGQVTGSYQRLSSSNTAILKLNQGESVWLESIINDSEVISGPNYRRTTFSGFLIY